jgi:PPOX class probable FMN-dependent enzyme
MDGTGDITAHDALRAHFGPVSVLAEKKQLAHLDRHCRAFIALSPFCVLATADGQGGVDASPRGDAPGFVRIIDDTTLLLPDRPGNRRVDSFRNIVAHPGVGLLFFVPGIDETVRVNGTGRIITDAELLADVAAQGKIPATGLLITVTEAFYHCAKALIRSKLWDPDTRIERKTFPTLGRIIADQTSGVDADAADAGIAEAYRTKLY